MIAGAGLPSTSRAGLFLHGLAGQELVSVGHPTPAECPFPEGLRENDLVSIRQSLCGPRRSQQGGGDAGAELSRVSP